MTLVYGKQFYFVTLFIIFVAIATSTITAIITERIAYRPLRIHRD